MTNSNKRSSKAQQRSLQQSRKTWSPDLMLLDKMRCFDDLFWRSKSYIAAYRNANQRCVPLPLVVPLGVPPSEEDSEVTEPPACSDSAYGSRQLPRLIKIIVLLCLFFRKIQACPFYGVHPTYDRGFL